MARYGCLPDASGVGHRKVGIIPRGYAVQCVWLDHCDSLEGKNTDRVLLCVRFL